MFIGRQKELALLNKAYAQESFQVVIVCGRDGAGKTALLEEFCRDKNSIFFTAGRESGRANLQRFSGLILEHYNDEKHGALGFWDSALTYIVQKETGGRKNTAEDDEYAYLMSAAEEKPEEKKKHLILVLDDFTELAERDSVFMSMFQNALDKTLKDSSIMLVISTSDVKFLQKTFLNKASALSQRVTAQLYVEKFMLTDDTVEQIKQEAVKSSIAWTGAKVKKFSADEVVLREGEKNGEMYKILSGRAVCYLNYGTDDEYALGSLKDNSSFGEFSLLTGKPGIYTVVAFTDILVLRIPEQEFQKFIEINAGNAVEIMKNMARMLNVMKVNIDMLHGEVAGS